MSAPTRHLYVHVPFCARRCSYCDFAIAVRREVPVREFVQALDAECRARAIDGLVLDTLYLGGGTPSRLGGAGVAAVLEMLRQRATLAAGAEVTLEANPEDVTSEAVAAWRGAGVTRLSLGVQSFDDAVLRWMHRVHDAAQAVRAVEVARAGGLDALSIDLIFAMPDGLVRDWSRDLATALALGPAHLSLYGLTVEEGTPLGRWRARGEVTESDEGRYEREFLEAHERLAEAGYEHYEVSNFARPGARARHNSAYWRGVPYLGVGPSAHGFDGDTRRWNVAAWAAWARRAAGGHDPVEGSEQLSRGNRVAETVYLGLRTADGLHLAPEERPLVERWQREGWVVLEDVPHGTVVRCTPRGWLRLDALAAALTVARSHS